MTPFYLIVFQGRVVRPNIECTNGYIHLVETVMLDSSPPWAVTSSALTVIADLCLLVPGVLLLLYSAYSWSFYFF